MGVTGAICACDDAEDAFGDGVVKGSVQCPGMVPVQMTDHLTGYLTGSCPKTPSERNGIFQLPPWFHLFSLKLTRTQPHVVAWNQLLDRLNDPSLS